MDELIRRQIVEKTLSEIRTFLYELLNKTRTYGTVHSLTQQIEHQYHGRFGIELLQNAHDALRVGKRGRVLFKLVTSEDVSGVLYVANDGKPFIKKDFYSIARLGQSEKHPNEAVGNKGIGFRSVLEICEAPEIYSKKDLKDLTFDGFCFQFTPRVVDALRSSIETMVHTGAVPTSHFAEGIPLVNWPSEWVRTLQDSIAAEAEGWLQHEIQLLSPYSLPLPIDDVPSSVADFASRGFSTVVRLPLVNQSAADEVVQRLRALTQDPTSVLFLESLTLLIIDINSDVIELQRTERRQAGNATGQQVTITTHSETEKQQSSSKRRFWCWSRQLGGTRDPDGARRIQQAVQKLPGKWPEMDKATVSVAVERGSRKGAGRYSIFLPTDILTGTGAYLNAPFYGNMSRTEVEFKESINQLLLDEAADLTAQVVLEDLIGGGDAEGIAVLDLLAPGSTYISIPRPYWVCLCSAFEQHERPLENTAIIRTDQGWAVPTAVRMLPEVNEAGVITDKVLRSHAQFAVAAEALSSRAEALQTLLDTIGKSSKPTNEEIASTIEAIAEGLLSGSVQGTWVAFWDDVGQICNRDLEMLHQSKVLLGSNGRLYAADGEGVQVFFPPQRGEAGESLLGSNVPPALSDQIAFLDAEMIPLAEAIPGGGTRSTSARRLLGDLVREFRPRDIINNIIRPTIPPLRLPFEAAESHLCKDILLWTARLVASRKSFQDLNLSEIPVPCIGGWQAAGNAMFGPVWPNSSGRDLLTYLEEADTPESQQYVEALVLPPDHKVWDGEGIAYVDFLKAAGVVDGLRLMHVAKADWEDDTQLSRYRYRLPYTSPPCFDGELWQSYKENIEPQLRRIYEGSYPYSWNHLYALPGLDRFEHLSDEGKEAFMRLVLASANLWPMSSSSDGRRSSRQWETCRLEKIGGETHNFTVTSPLFFALQTLPWIHIGEKEQQRAAPPQGWWILPESVMRSARRYQYHYLHPFPAEQLDASDSDVLDLLERLGMQRALLDDADRSTSPELLEALAKAWSRDNAGATPRHFFVNHLRSAWRSFEPNEERLMPSQMVVQRGPTKLESATPQTATPVYLPDATPDRVAALEAQRLPVIVIDKSDAERLRAALTEAYESAIKPISELQIALRVDDALWEPTDDLPYLSTSGVGWLVDVLLTVVAFGGQRITGPQTGAFQVTAARLRGTRLAYADDITTVLREGEQDLASVKLGGWWDEEINVLIVQRHALLKQWSEALSRILKRRDLDVPLRLVLSNLDVDVNPSEEEVLNALQDLDITKAQWDEARERARGEVPWILSRLEPVLVLLGMENENNRWRDVTSVAELQDTLGELQFEGIDAATLVELCRSSHDDEQVGRRLVGYLPKRAELDQWNQALGQLDPPGPAIQNEQDTYQFEAHYHAARPALRAALRHAGHTRGTSQQVPQLLQELETISCPEDYAVRYWTVTFRRAMHVYAETLQQWQVATEIVQAIRNANDKEALHQALEGAGLDPYLDPVQLYNDNKKKSLQAFRRLRHVGLTWCQRHMKDKAPWLLPEKQLFASIQVRLDQQGYCVRWDEEQCYEQLVQALNKGVEGQEHDAFWNMALASRDVDELITSLGFAGQELADVDAILEQVREKEARQKRMQEVCGMPFENVEVKLFELWDHVVQHAPDDQVARVDIERYTSLQEVKTKRRGRPTTSSGGGSSKRMSAHLKNLVGLMGEIHAMRILQATYGKVVTPAAWISSNSRYRFEENAVNDGAGYDFRFERDGTTYYVEVKATLEESDRFDMGISEIEEARRLANVRRAKYLIFRVSYALSSTPLIDVLPNPYAPDSASFYKFEKTGVRLRFRKK